jgi:hypothetical protein
MSRKKRPKPLYQRGSYKLYARPDRGNLEIIWYDEARKRERSRSAGTGSVEDGRAEVDRLYLETEGKAICPTCGQPRHRDTQLVTAAVADFLTLNRDRSGAASMGYRLAHIVNFVNAVDPAMTCATFDEARAEEFRQWLAREKDSAPATIEGSLVQLAAAIRATQPVAPAFKTLPLRDLNRSPQHRSEVEELAAMFKYALTDTRTKKQRENDAPMPRENLLRYLRAAVATLARPDAIYDISTTPERRQWNSRARALNLNPAGRRQTRKRRAHIPIAKQFAPHLDSVDGPYIPVDSVRTAWEAMADKLKLPKDREAGQKLIRRSMASLIRDRIGETNYPQVKRFLGHTAADVSDIYALAKPEQLGIALAEIERIIDEIEALAPGAYRKVTAKSLAIRAVE